jgi:RimJ/RimL family protein N-acetyltransferase
MDGDPEVMKYISSGCVMTPQETKTTLARIEFRNTRLKKFGVWAADLKATGEFTGWFFLKPMPGTKEMELGYRLRKKFWGQGLATEGAIRVRDYGFQEAGLSRIVAITHLENQNSAKVLTKVGFRIQKQMDFNSVKVNYWESIRGAGYFPKLFS